MNLRTLPIAELLPAANNPRRISPAQRRKLRQSLARFGLVEPLVWNKQTGELVGGHQRLSILQELGQTDVPVVEVDLTRPQQNALNIVLNNAEAQGRFDAGKLRVLLAELAPLPELEDTGFGPEMLRNLELAPTEELPSPCEEFLEVVLRMPPATYAAIAERLNALVQEFDLAVSFR
ncbi:MAG: ParB N-terminal domain-containing protein, partial [Gemmataceae bacterium]